MRNFWIALSLGLVAGCGGSDSPGGGHPDGASDGAGALDAGEADGATTMQSDAASDAAVQIGPNPACTTDGCLRAITKIGDYNMAALAPFLSPGVVIENGYSVYTIQYATFGRTALATVAVPYQVATPTGGWHVVANNHGTSGIDDHCVTAGTIAGAGLAGTFGARGLIGVAVDYPGMGTPGVHPYLVSESEGRASLDALRAVRVFAADRGIALSQKFAMVGLSQGGHVTLAAAALHGTYAPDLNIRAFGAAAPASVWEEHFRIGVQNDGPHIAYHALMVYAWADYYGYQGPQLWSQAMAPQIADIAQNSCVVSISGEPTIFARIGTSGAAVFSPDFLSAFRSGQWGAFASFGTWFTANRIRPYTQTAPLKIYQGSADTTVLEAATQALVDALRAGGVTVEYDVVPGGQHTTVAFGFVANQELRTNESISWIKGRLAQ